MTVDPKNEINEACKNQLFRLGIKMPVKEEQVVADQTDVWLEEVTSFIKSYDFMRLGMAVTHKQWQGAAMNIRRMDLQAKKIGAECFYRQFTGLKQNVAGRNVLECKQILALVTAKRVKIIECLNERERVLKKIIQNIGQKEMQIRKATMSDLNEISLVEAACFPAAEAATRESFEKRLTVYPDYFWVLEADNRIISFVNGMVSDEPDLADEMYENAALHKADGKWQMIFGVNTLPEYRRHGYAEQVLKQVIADAKEQGRAGLVLTCKEHMLHYYGRLGFVNEGVSESVHGNVMWYQMRLTFD